MRPAVSVIVPCFNHALYIEQRLESIFEQSYRNFELIVLDDASSDGSQEILKRIAAAKRCSLHINKQNSGSPFKQWNSGVRLARNPLIWIAESDDFCEPDFLEKLVAIYEQRPQLGLAYCQSIVTNESGQNLGKYTQYSSGRDAARWDKSFVADGREECAEYLIVENTIPNASAVVFKRDLYMQCGGAPGDMRFCGDWWVWANMLLQSEFAFEARALNYFRRIKSPYGSVRHFLPEAFRVCRMIASNTRLSAKQLEASRAMLTQQVVKWLFENLFRANPLQAAQLISQSLQYDPLAFRRIPKIAANYLFRGATKPSL